MDAGYSEAAEAAWRETVTEILCPDCGETVEMTNEAAAWMDTYGDLRAMHPCP